MEEIMSKFITFEGGEGSGKTTQATKLCDFLRSEGKEVLLTREPGGTMLAEKLRSEILLKDGGVDDPLTEFLIITAARRDHIEKVIKPKLAEGVYVICDRFYDSSLAYQSYYKGLQQPIMEELHQLATGGFQPDITFLLDVDVDKSMKRITTRGGQNHYDLKGGDFNLIIQEAYREIAEHNKARIFKVDSSGEIDEIFEKIRDIVKKNDQMQQ